MIDKSPEALFIIDDGQRIVEWSDTAAVTLGVSAQAALGKPCYDVVRGRDPFGRLVCTPDCPAFKALQSGRLGSECTLVVNRQGQPGRRFVGKLNALPKPPGGAVVTLVDGSRQVSATPLTSAVDTTRDLATLTALSASLSSSSLDQGTEQALDWLRQTTKAEAAELFLAEPGGGDLLLTAHHGIFRNAFTQISRFRPGEGFPGLVAATQAPVVTRDLPGDPRYLRTQVKERGFLSYVCVPLLLSSGQVLGSLNVASREAPFDTDRALRLLTWTGRVVSPFLEAGILRQRLSVAVPFGATHGGDKPGLNSALRAVLHQITTLGNAPGGALLLYHRDVQGVACRVTEGDFPGVACPDAQRGDLHLCPALGAGHGVALYGPRHQWSLPCQRMSIRGGLVYCLPLVAAGEPIGVAQLGYVKRVPWPPTRLLPTLMQVAQQASDLIGWAWQSSRSQQRTASPWPPPEVRVHRDGSRPETRALRSPSEPPDREPAEQTPFLDIRCLGPFELYRQGRLVTREMFVRHGALTLLKVLLVHEGRPVTRDGLMEILWPETDPATAANRLYVLVHTLRRTVEPAPQGPPWTYIRREGDSYYFNMNASYRWDVREFRGHLSLGEELERDGKTSAAIDVYEAAMSLYTGDLLEEEPYADWCWYQRESLREVHLQALRRLAALYLDRNRPERSVEMYQRALRADPLREDMHQGLMRALWAAGRRNEALHQYQACKDVLLRELDVAPLPETERLYLALRDNGPI